jgi:hypothetical protein
MIVSPSRAGGGAVIVTLPDTGGERVRRLEQEVEWLAALLAANWQLLFALAGSFPKQTHAAAAERANAIDRARVFGCSQLLVRWSLIAKSSRRLRLSGN